MMLTLKSNKEVYVPNPEYCLQMEEIV